MVVLKHCMADFIVSCLVTHFGSGWMLGRCSLSVVVECNRHPEEVVDVLCLSLPKRRLDNAPNNTLYLV